MKCVSKSTTSRIFLILLLARDVKCKEAWQGLVAAQEVPFCRVSTALCARSSDVAIIHWIIVHRSGTRESRYLVQDLAAGTRVDSICVSQTDCFGVVLNVVLCEAVLLDSSSGVRCSLDLQEPQSPRFQCLT